MCNNKDFFERQQVEMLLSAELAKPYQEMDPDFIKECSDFLFQIDGYPAAYSAHSALSEEEIANRVKTILSARKRRFLRRLSLISACLAAAFVALHWVT